MFVWVIDPWNFVAPSLQTPVFQNGKKIYKTKIYLPKRIVPKRLNRLISTKYVIIVKMHKFVFIF